MQGYRLDRERGPTKVPLSRSGAQSAVRLPLGPLDSNVKDTTDLFLLGKGQGVAQQDYSAAVHSNRPIEQPTANPRPPGRSPEPPQVATSRHISECHILISGPGPGRLPSVAVEIIDSRRRKAKKPKKLKSTSLHYGTGRRCNSRVCR